MIVGARKQFSDDFDETIGVFLDDQSGRSAEISLQQLDQGGNVAFVFPEVFVHHCGQKLLVDGAGLLSGLEQDGHQLKHVRSEFC